MKKNTELVEFFICPHCNRSNWELVDFIPLESSVEYECLAECDHCGQEFLVIDVSSRCAKCKNKVECIATPLKNVYSVAMAIHDQLSKLELQQILRKLEDQNEFSPST